MNDDIYQLKEDEQFEYESEGSGRQKNSFDNGWIVGIIFIAVGVGLLTSGYTGFAFHNWWALFVLIPALGSFAQAWQAYQRHGRLNAAARNGLIGGLFMSLIASVFLFGLSWSLVWPIGLIIMGIAALTNRSKFG